MYVRFDVGTDVAMLGAWDTRRAAQVLTGDEAKNRADVLTADAEAGYVFWINTGADGGGPVDVYVDETPVSDIKRSLTFLGGDFLLSVPSGELIVDGAEFYRASTDSVKERRPARVRPGDYAVRCYEWTDVESTPKTEAELERLVGRADVVYYDRLNHIGCWSVIAMVLLFPVWWYVWGFTIGLVVMVVSTSGSLHLHRWILKRNKRYQRLLEIIPTYRLQHEDPGFVLELRFISAREGLRGGSVSAS
jgi:hypothetical protein